MRLCDTAAGSEVPVESVSRLYQSCLTLLDLIPNDLFSDELAGNAILHCFGAAVAQATRDQKMGSSGGKLDKPVVMKAVQLIEGRMDLVLVQLNSLQLRVGQRNGRMTVEGDTGGGDVKNQVWLEKCKSCGREHQMYL